MICKAILLINCTLFPWNEHDQKIVKYATENCEKKYGPETPCVSKVTKLGKRDYRILCGEMTDDKYTGPISKEADPTTRTKECST